MGRPGETLELQFEESRDEIAIWLEPVTGAAIQGYERVQTNWYVEQTLLDSMRYANIFSAESDNDDVFVWPYLYISGGGGITEEGAAVAFHAGLYDLFILTMLVYKYAV